MSSTIRHPADGAARHAPGPSWCSLVCTYGHAPRTVTVPERGHRDGANRWARSEGADLSRCRGVEPPACSVARPYLGRRGVSGGLKQGWRRHGSLGLKGRARRPDGIGRKQKDKRDRVYGVSSPWNGMLSSIDGLFFR